MCQQLHLDYYKMYYEIPYNNLQKMVADLPGYDPDGKDDEAPKEEDLQSVINLMNKQTKNG